jgi:hypothetical protein
MSRNSALALSAILGFERLSLVKGEGYHGLESARVIHEPSPSGLPSRLYGFADRVRNAYIAWLRQKGPTESRLKKTGRSRSPIRRGRQATENRVSEAGLRNRARIGVWAAKAVRPTGPAPSGQAF